MVFTFSILQIKLVLVITCRYFITELKVSFCAQGKTKTIFLKGCCSNSYINLYIGLLKYECKWQKIFQINAKRVSTWLLVSRDIQKPNQIPIVRKKLEIEICSQNNKNLVLTHFKIVLKAFMKSAQAHQFSFLLPTNSLPSFMGRYVVSVKAIKNMASSARPLAVGQGEDGGVD